MNIKTSHKPRERDSTEGSAVIVILAFLAIMVLLVAANTKTVNWVRVEIRLTDQREIARLAGGGATNQNATAVSPVPHTTSP